MFILVASSNSWNLNVNKCSDKSCRWRPDLNPGPLMSEETDMSAAPSLSFFLLCFFSCFCLFLSLSFSLSVFLNQRLSLFPFHPWDVIRNFCVEISRNNSQAGSGFIDFLNVWSAQNISEGSEHQIQSLNNSKSQFRQNKPFYKTDEFGPLHVYSVVIYFAKQLMI